jgi:hypothetical protein
VPERMEECGEAHKEDGHPSVGCIAVSIGVKVVLLTAFPDVVDGLRSTLSSCLPKRHLDMSTWCVAVQMEQTWRQTQ